MGYRIEYQPVPKLRRVKKRRSAALALTGIFFLLFCVLVNLLWARGAEVLGKLFFSGNVAVTVDALEHFVMELGAGEEFPSAFETFCRTVIQHGQADLY